MSEQYARDGLLMRKLLDELRFADKNQDRPNALRLASRIIRLRERWSREMGTPKEYARFRTLDPDGGEHTAIAPASASKEEVMSQIDSDTRNVNNWASFSSYCVEQLQLHAKGELLRQRTKDWYGDLVLASLSFPALLLVLGGFVGWVWRGFRPAKR